METVTSDTNLYISALNFAGRPLELLELARSGVIRLAITNEIEAEVRRVLAEKFAWEAGRIDRAMQDIASYTHRVQPTQRLAVVQHDPTDDRILECAVASGSSVLVSGDKHLLTLGQYEGMPIMRVAEFLGRQPR